jgi:hypothetical protein
VENRVAGIYRVGHAVGSWSLTKHRFGGLAFGPGSPFEKGGSTLRDLYSDKRHRFWSMVHETDWPFPWRWGLQRVGRPHRRCRAPCNDHGTHPPRRQQHREFIAGPPLGIQS